MLPNPDDDHYAVLGIASRAGAAEIRRAYRQLALRHHPDRAGIGATARFQRIALAYRVLSDPASRAAYDAARASRTAAPNTHAAPGGVRASTSPAAGAASVPDLIARLNAPLDALIAQAAARRNEDGLIELLLTASEAQSGGTAAIGVPMRVSCPTCGGCAQPRSVWCMRCQFDGTVPEEVTVCIAIPPLVGDGTTFTVRVDPTGATPPLRVRVKL